MEKTLGDIPEGVRKITEALEKRFGRPPTEHEVYRFIMGDREEQTAIWNTEHVGTDTKD
jgi:hypothetical protein